MVFNTEEVYNNGLIILQMLMCMAQILCVLIMSMKILIYTSSDAYDIDIFNNTFLNKNVKCDLL